MELRFILSTLSITSLLLLSACLGTQTPAPVSIYGVQAGAGSTGVHTVQPGDTLWSISKRYKIAMRDIVLENKLSEPFVLNSGERLRLPPPLEYKVRAGDTLYSVSRLFNTSRHEVAKLNNLASPYRIHDGQVLRLPSDTHRPVSRISAMPETETTARADAKPVARSQPKTRITAKTPKRSSSKFLMPVEGRVISRYGPKKGGLHNDGINIAAPRGARVKSAENGVVVYAGNELKGSGNLVLIRHEGGWMTAYAHLERIGVKRGQTVKRGNKIGSVGSTGSVDSPQLHFEVRRGTKALNPARYLGV